MTKDRKSAWGAIVSIVAVQKERIGIIGTGLVVNELTDRLFDFVLYPFVVVRFGMLKGGIAMSLASFLICWLMMLFYDWSKKDWLGIEMIKEARKYHGTSRIRSWIASVMRKSELLTLIVLSLNFDPFITTAYMRKGVGQFNGMWRRDWRIFFSSWLIGNAYWTVATFYGATLVMRYGGQIVSLFGAAAKAFIVLAILTVIFKKKLFFITSRAWRRLSSLERYRRRKAFLVLASEGFAWAIIIYYVVRIGNGTRFFREWMSR